MSGYRQKGLNILRDLTHRTHLLLGVLKLITKVETYGYDGVSDSDGVTGWTGVRTEGGSVRVKDSGRESFL